MSIIKAAIHTFKNVANSSHVVPVAAVLGLGIAVSSSYFNSVAQDNDVAADISAQNDSPQGIQPRTELADDISGENISGTQQNTQDEHGAFVTAPIIQSTRQPGH